jgi:hypothetical protein
MSGKANHEALKFGFEIRTFFWKSPPYQITGGALVPLSKESCQRFSLLCVTTLYRGVSPYLSSENQCLQLELGIVMSAPVGKLYGRDGKPT